MIIVRRSSSNVNKLQRNILSMSTNSTMSSPLVPASTSRTSAGAAGTGAGTCGGGQSQSFDWSCVFSPENKSKTIELLTLDRENFGYNIAYSANNAYTRKAAVLIPLCYDKEGRPSLLYNLRALTLSSHGGEISFPGGALDPEDKDCPVAASVRETNEELGIPPDAIEIWTTLRMFPTISSNRGVVPVLGFINGLVDASKLKICQHEVDHAFTVTLEHLCNPENWEEGPRKKFKGRGYHIPMWKNIGCYKGAEQVHLWGLTAFVTHIALLALLPKHVYQRKLKYLQLQLKDHKSPKL